MRVTPALVAAGLLLALGACGDPQPQPPDTRRLGAQGPGPATAGFTDSQGRALPLPPQLPPQTAVQLVRASEDGALALWVQDGTVLAASYRRGMGWSEPAPLEDIYGQASDAQLASSGRGSAIALWRHTVGRIESLRFSVYDASSGWSTPDVVPGALPRRRPEGAAPGLAGRDAPQLSMDSDGNAFAEWPSGFDPGEVQTARYVAGRGWTRALSQPVAATPTPAPSAAGVQ